MYEFVQGVEGGGDRKGVTGGRTMDGEREREVKEE